MEVAPIWLAKVVLAAITVQTNQPLNLAQPLSLSDVVHETQLHSAEVRAAKDDVAAARARTGEQNSRLKPQFGFVGSSVRYDGPSNLNFAGQKIEVVPDHIETLSLELNQIIDVTNQVGTSVSQAKLYALSSEYGLESTSEDAALAGTTAYYNMLRAKQSVRVAQDSLKAYQEQLKTTTRLFEGGVGQKIDVLRAQSQVADAERELVGRQNDYDSARSKVNDLVGRPVDAETTLIETPEVAKADPGTLDAKNRQTLIKQAQDHRAEALGAETEVRAAEKGIKLAKASTEPQVSIGLAGNYYPTTSFQDVRHSTASLTLGVNFPIYDGGLARERVQEAKALVDSSKSHKDRVERDIALQVQNAVLDIETARKRLEAASTAVVAATSARELAQQRYEAQVGVYLEITDSQAALTQAQAAQVNAAYDLLIARARLSRALGEPLQETGLQKTGLVK